MNFMLEWQKHDHDYSFATHTALKFPSQSKNTDMRSSDIPTCNTEHVFLIFSLFLPVSHDRF